MNKGRALAIFDNIENASESIEEKGEAIRSRIGDFVRSERSN